MRPCCLASHKANGTVADPATEDLPIEELLSASYLERRREAIDRSRTTRLPLPGPGSAGNDVECEGVLAVGSYDNVEVKDGKFCRIDPGTLVDNVKVGIRHCFSR